MEQKQICMQCKKELEKNAEGLNYKYLGRTINKFYCIKCLSEFLNVTEEGLYRQIEYFKSTGCSLFE